MTPTQDTLDDGAIIADLIVDVESSTTVTTLRRRCTAKAYGDNALFIRVCEFGVPRLIALRSARGWEFAA